MLALKKTATLSAWKANTRRRLPSYANQLDPRADPVLITAEWEISKAIREMKGECLVCDFDPARCDFSFLNGREIFILWLEDQEAARRIGDFVSVGGAGSGCIIKAEALRP